MAVSARALVDGFRSIVGADHARDDVTSRRSAALDGVVPALVVAPASGEETAAVVAVAAAERLAVVPRGAGTSLEQGHPVTRADLVLDVSRLDRIVEYNADDLTVTVETGVTAGSLAATLGARGQLLAIDPPGVASRTLGGLIATNASGPLRARYGTLRDLLLGVRFVQADGVVTWGGSKVVKSVTGYDVPKLMVGALGTLGVLTEFTLRLHARPPAERTWLIAAPDVPAVQALVLRILDSALQPNRLEIVDAPTMSALGGDAAPGLAVSFGSVEAAVTEQGVELARLAGEIGARAAAASPAVWTQYDRLWHRDPETTMLLLGAMPSRLAETFAAVADASAILGDQSRLTLGGSAAVGSVRALVRHAAASAVAAFVDEVRAAVGAWNGTVMVQGAPRDVRAAMDPWGPVPPDAFALMRLVKSTFDPDGRLNPGRFVGGL